MKTTKNLICLAFAVLAFAYFALAPQARATCQDACLPGFNTVQGDDAFSLLTTGEANTALGWRALFSVGGGFNNTAVGTAALVLNTADSNTAVGAAALLLNGTGVQNTAVGTGALVDNDSGDSNVAVGAGAGANIVTGGGNTYIGAGVAGPADESNTVRIADNLPTFAGPACFIGGIVTNITGSALPVVTIDPVTQQLGIFSSSARFKKDIKPMDEASESIFALKPVTFRDKNDLQGIGQFGLVAEEVVKVNPDLVALDRDGKPYTVRNDAVNAMLLNEFLKEHKTVQQQGQTIARLEKQLETVTATLQKVSAQLAAPSPSLADLR